MRRIAPMLLLLVVQPLMAAVSVPKRGPVVDGGPAVTFDGQFLVVSGAKSGSPVYAAGVQLRGGDYMLTVEKPAATAIAASDGSARLDMGKKITARSVWVVVDGSGGYTVSGGPGSLLREIPMPGAGAVAADGLLHRLSFQRPSMDIVLIRPATGMWGARMWDGRTNDDDHALNGAVSADLRVLEGIGGTAVLVPDRIAPGDVLFVVNRYSLEFTVARQGR